MQFCFISKNNLHPITFFTMIYTPIIFINSFLNKLVPFLKSIIQEYFLQPSRTTAENVKSKQIER